MADSWSWWLAGIVVLFAALNGIIAIWAARGRAFWFWRCLMLVTPVALLAAVPAPDLVVVYLAETGTVLLADGVSTLVRNVLSMRNQGRKLAAKQLRFGLRDVLLGLTLVGVLLAGLRLMPLQVEFGLGYLCVAGIGLGIMACCAYWATHGARWPEVRWKLLPVGAVAVALVWHGVGLKVAFGAKQTPFDYRSLVVLGAAAAAIVVWLALARAGGVFVAVRLNGARRRSRAAAIASWTVFLAYLLPNAAMYVVFVWPVPIVVAAATPRPNGYKEVVKAVALIDWSAVPEHYTDDDGLAREFAADNAAIWGRISKALRLPAVVPQRFDKSAPNAKLGEVMALRTLCRALNLDARVAMQDGFADRAIQRHIDQLQLCEMAIRGGRHTDCQIGIAIFNVSAPGIGRLIDRLNAGQSKQLAEALAALELPPEPVELIWKREESFIWNAYGWGSRVIIVIGWLNGRSSHFQAFSGPLQEQLHRSRSVLRLLQARLALRRFEIDRGGRPASLVELVPRYLPSVPLDPFDNRPLRYKRLDTGHQLYSIGPNRIDDGGELVSTADAMSRGDLFLAAWDLDDAQQKAQAAAAAKEAAQAAEEAAEAAQALEED